MEQKKTITPSINQLTAPLLHSLIENAASLRISADRMENGTMIVDAGIHSLGGLEAGRQIAEICMGGLGTARLRASTTFEQWSWHIDIHSTNPVLSCLGSQYAGWILSHGEGEDAFNALGSGPGRAIGSKEGLFDRIHYRDTADATSLVIETDKFPPLGMTDDIAKKCHVSSDQLTLILSPTSSLSGCVQVVARVLETALHKADALGFPLDDIVDGAGSVPVCPPSRSYITAMSRTNDAILFAGQVQLYVDCDDQDAQELAEKLPSSASSDYGRPFGEIFKAVNYDFYQIDPMLFSPARVTISSLKTGRSFHSGKIDLALLNHSFSNEID